MAYDCPGFPKLPVAGKDEMRPNARDARTEVTPTLKYCRPVSMVMDFGAPRDAMSDWRGAPSPSLPTFRAGTPPTMPTSKPEPGNVPIQPGITIGDRRGKTVSS
jgi:hypothetical protein